MQQEFDFPSEYETPRLKYAKMTSRRNFSLMPNSAEPYGYLGVFDYEDDYYNVDRNVED